MWGGSSERGTIMDELARSIKGARRLRCFGGALEACWSLVLAVRIVAGCDVHMLVLPLCGILLGLLFVSSYARRICRALGVECDE